MTVSIHPTALVDKKAELDSDVTVGPYSVISGRVKIGRGSTIASFVRIHDYVQAGEECIFHENSIIGGAPQDHDYNGEETWVMLGNRDIIRENVTINRSTGEGTATVVGDNCFIMEGVHIAHNVTVGNNVIMSNKTGLAGHCSIGDNTVLGGISGVHQFVKVGRFCMIGGLSKVVKDIPPFLLVDGHPGRIYSTNSIGLRRAGFTPEERSRIKKIYQKIFHSGKAFRAVLDECRQEWSEDYLAREILDFIKDSNRGIEKWPYTKKERQQ